MTCRYKVTVLEKAEALAGHRPPGALHLRSASMSAISTLQLEPTPSPKLKITRKEGKMSQQINQITVTEGL